LQVLLEVKLITTSSKDQKYVGWKIVGSVA